MKKNSLVLVLLLFVVVSCNNVSMQDEFSFETYNEDIKKLNESKSLSDGDKTVMLSYIKLFDKADTTLYGTYSDILSNAKAYLANAERERQQMLAYLEIQKKLNESILVKVKRKYTENLYDEGYLKNFLLIDVVVENTTEKKVSGFTVRISFKNADGNVFYSADWPVAKVIKAKSKLTMPLSTGEYKNTNIEQSKLKAADLSKISIDYEILEIMYDDGTTLNLQ